MDVSQQFIPIGQPIGYLDQFGQVFPNDAMIRILLTFFNRTGQEPGTTPDDIAAQAAFIALILARPQSSASASGAFSAPYVVSETIQAPALVNTWSNGGVFSARNADGGTTGKDCHGFIGGSKTLVTGQTAVVSFVGIMQGLAGPLTPGYAYLGATGAVSSSSETAGGDTAQRVGIATSATSVFIAPQVSVGL